MVIAVLVVAVAGFTFYAVYLASWLSVTTVEVTGVRTGQYGRVVEAARVPMGTPLARVRLDAIRARVENLAFVEGAVIDRSWPHTITVDVTPRVPVAVVDRGSGLQEMDRFGVVFGTRASVGRLPLIRADATLGSDVLAGAGKVAGSLPSGLDHRVRYLQIHSADDIELLMRSGQRVLWGSAADSAQKAQIARLLLRKKVTLVDVSTPGRPSTRP